jgi:hypothetical protein
VTAARHINAWAIAAKLLLGLSVLVAVLFTLNMLGLLAPGSGKPPGLDFVAFWAAAKLSLAGDILGAYNPAVIEPFERAHTVLQGEGYLAFYYPPPYLLLCLPLGLVGYLPALFGFIAAQAAIFFPVIRAIAPRSWGWTPVLASPGFLMNLAAGQNGPLWTTCLALALLLLERAPFLAGLSLGMLVCKPQLALCVPIVLLLSPHRWLAIAGSAASATSLCLASLAVPGLTAWRGFFAATADVRRSTDTIAGRWPHMQSVYSGVRMVGGGIGAGYTIQAAVTLTAAVLLAVVCLRRPKPGAPVAALCAACVLATPFFHDYDLVVLTPALAWLASDADRQGWRTGEKLLCAALFLFPLVARASAMALATVLAPPLVLCLLLAIACRARQAPAAAA